MRRVPGLSLDPELGRVRRCDCCGVWWPDDREFYPYLGPQIRDRTCRACVSNHSYGHAYRARLRQAVGAVRVARARARGYNVRTEYSGPIAHNAKRPRAGCTPVSGTLAISEYRRDA